MNKTNTPKLRFKEFAGEWQEKKLGDIAIVERGRFSPRPRNDPRYYNGNIPFVQTGDIIKANGTIYHYTQTLNADGLKVSKLFPAGTILITIAANIGYTGVLEIDMACPDSLVGIRCKKDLIDNHFLNYYLVTQQEHMSRIASEAAQKNINIEFLKPYKVPVASLKEQEKIAGVLTAVDEKINKLGGKKKGFLKYKKGVMQAIFSQKIRFKKSGGSNYPDWEEKKLGEMVSFHRGASLSKTDLRPDGKYECIHYGELFTEYTEVINGVKSRTNVNTNVNGEVGDILMPTSDVTPQGLAKACSLQIGGVKLGGDINILRPNRLVNSIMLSYLLNYQKKKIMEIVSGTTVRHIYSKDLSKLKFSFSDSPEEQEKIAEFLTFLDNKAELINKELERAKLFKKSLLQQMFV